jgi:hypothetical protein
VEFCAFHDQISIKSYSSTTQYIQSQMPANNQKAKQGRREFKMTFIERAMLVEPKELIELFEVSTNEVSISRVFP